MRYFISLYYHFVHFPTSLLCICTIKISKMLFSFSPLTAMIKKLTCGKRAGDLRGRVSCWSSSWGLLCRYLQALTPAGGKVKPCPQWAAWSLLCPRLTVLLHPESHQELRGPTVTTHTDAVTMGYRLLWVRVKFFSGRLWPQDVWPTWMSLRLLQLLLPVVLFLL